MIKRKTNHEDRMKEIFGEEAQEQEYMEKDTVDIAGDAEEEVDCEDDDQEEDNVVDDDEEDLLTLEAPPKREAQLPKGDYIAQVGKVTAERKIGETGKSWIKATIPFNIKKSGGGTITIPFIASKNILPTGRLYPILEGILGEPPEPGFNLRQIEGKRVKVKIGHNEDSNGNVWEEILAVKKAS